MYSSWAVDPSSSLPAKSDKANDRRTHACTICYRRKVKCDRQNPCANCRKDGVECVMMVPTPPRRRRKDFDPAGTNRRLRQESTTSEDRLSGRGSQEIQLSKRIRLNGTDNDQPEFRSVIEPVNDFTSASSSPAAPTTGFSWLEPESPDFNAGIFLMLAEPDDYPIAEIALERSQIRLLWRKFLINVNPMSKVVHVPTLEPTLPTDAKAFTSLSWPEKALFLAVFVTAMLSMTDGECEVNFEQSRTTLVQRYMLYTRQALGRTGFFASNNQTVLQAYSIFLVILRKSLCDASLVLTSPTAGTARKPPPDCLLDHDGHSSTHGRGHGPLCRYEEPPYNL